MTTTKVRWMPMEGPGDTFEQTYDLSKEEDWTAYEALSETHHRQILEHHSSELALQQEMTKRSAERVNKLVQDRMTQAELNKLVG